MAYRYDKDLEFLGELSNDELDVLVKMLTKDEKGGVRVTESLTSSEEYKKHFPDHQKYWRAVAEEIQTFGGNTFMNLIRQGGVEYKEILIDVCKKMKVNFNEKSSTQLIEQNLLMKVLEDSIQKMSPEDLQELVKDLDLKTTDFSKQAVLGAMQVAIKMSGFKIYQLSVIIANAIAKAILGTGLTLATNATITRAISIFAGPIGWILTGLWTAIDIAGPAYRITIPVCIQIACLRAIHQYGEDSK